MLKADLNSIGCWLNVLSDRATLQKVTGAEIGYFRRCPFLLWAESWKTFLKTKLTLGLDWSWKSLSFSKVPVIAASEQQYPIKSRNPAGGLARKELSVRYSVIKDRLLFSGLTT